jgi:hypothetical protein
MNKARKRWALGEEERRNGISGWAMTWELINWNVK